MVANIAKPSGKQGFELLGNRLFPLFVNIAQVFLVRYGPGSQMQKTG